MKQTIYSLILALLCASCTTSRKSTAESVTCDSFVNHLHTERQQIVDTIEVLIPYLTAESYTRDSLSILDNQYAHSEASVTDGVLHHTLETKPQQQAVAVVREIVTRDSIVYRTKTQEVVSTTTVTKKDLRTKLALYGLLALNVAVLLFVAYRKLRSKFTLL